MKKFLKSLLLTILLFVISFCAYNLIDYCASQNGKYSIDDLVDSVTNTITVGENYFEKSTYLYAYNSLQSQTQQNIYDAIMLKIYNITDTTDNERYLIEKVELNNLIVTEFDIIYAVEAITRDYPELFYLSNDYNYNIYSDNSATITLKSNYSKQEVESMLSQIEKAGQDIISNIPAGLSDFEVELYIHDYLVDNCKYKNKYINNPKKGNLYDALIEGKTICEGYACAFQYLLNLAGIDCVNITGVGEGDSHMWNAVKIDDSWYYVDVTWDDANKFSRYNYFNVSENQLIYDHTIFDAFDGEDNYNIVEVKCNSTEYNYFKQKAVQLTDLDDNNMPYELAKAYANNKDLLYVYIDPKYLDFDTTVEKLFDNYYLSKYIRKANSDYSINLSYEIEYLLCEQLNGFIMGVK